MTVADHVQLALQHHLAGRLAEAESIYRQVLAVFPNHDGCLHLLGMIAFQRNQLPDAAALVTRAIALNPGVLDYHNNLALIRTAEGKHEEAVAACRRGLEIKPDSADVYSNLGNALRDLGRLEEAIAAFAAALRFRPNFASAYNNLGVALKESGRIEEAITAYRAAVQIEPNLPEAYDNLGTALKDRGQKEESLAAYQRALQLQPNSARAHNNLGIALNDLGQTAAAITSFETALRIQPDLAEAHNNLGLALRKSRQPQAAEAAFRTALQVKPDYVEARNNLGLALKDQAQIDAAIAAYQEVLRFRPDLSAAHNNLANALKDGGRIEEAITAYRQAIHFSPGNAVYLSNLIYALYHSAEIDAMAIHDAQAEWNRLFTAPLRTGATPPRNVPDPARRLRVGYISPDLHAHAVSFFLAPLFAAHDRAQCEVHVYASVAQPDVVTARLRELADVWHDIFPLSDEEVAARVREDGIDILVDLSMHTAENRLLVFAREPAPLQISWLAHAGSSGVETIRHRLSDDKIEPDDLVDAASTERVIRLPESWCCYAPVDDFPAVGTLPARQHSVVTFGSLNQFAKIKEATLRGWAELLRRVPHSRLLMVCPPGQAAERASRLFAAQGVDPVRLELFAPGPWAAYVQLFGKIDVALDSFPFNGMTTTCHALWMGVPVVSLSGEHPISRTGLSLLHTVGLPEFAAASPAEYLEIAAKWAMDLDRLEELRSTLRARMQASPLMDAPRFARNIEAAYRRLWREWCETRRAR
ncbi:MAG TPA: tetratricopeptide repeat protein [Chthoniobacter sp.]|jgi:predicted O-linked N-acetylglucosamine transferase (SPINDLY family)